MSHILSPNSLNEHPTESLHSLNDTNEANPSTPSPLFHSPVNNSIHNFHDSPSHTISSNSPASSPDIQPALQPTIQPEIQFEPQLVLPFFPSHPMITRAKNGIFKPNQFLNMSLLCETHLEPATITDALSHPEWQKAMNSMFQAFLKNDTWDLVPYLEDINFVTNKWVFRVKYKADGSVDRFKAWLVAKGFQQLAGIDFFETFSPVTIYYSCHVFFSCYTCIRYSTGY